MISISGIVIYIIDDSDITFIGLVKNIFIAFNIAVNYCCFDAF